MISIIKLIPPIETRQGDVRKTSSSILLLALLFVLACGPADGVISVQQTFKIQKASKKYDLIVKIDSCDQGELPDFCTGTGQVDISKKGEQAVFQTLDQDSIHLNKIKTAYNPELNQKPRVLYDDEYSFIFGDFNFDGEEDLAICNGTNGGYGGPSYTIYLFEKRSKRFVENKKLSDLADGVYLGLFFPDPNRKLLHAYWKSGVGFHAEEVYRVVNNRPVLIEKTEEEATATDYWIITTHKRMNGKWVKRVRRVKIKDNG
jgi:hypothetical protein